MATRKTIRSKWAYWEELRDNQAQPPVVDNDLIVYQDWTKTAGNTVSNNNESDVQPLDKNYDPNVDLNPEYLSQMDMNTPIRWANQSFSEYWDDSSRDKQSTPWGENAKYTWENTKNSDVAYNPDIKTGDLNPYYVYGRTSQVYGTMHPWYISQRNDNIASALYNEWKRSKEEVEQFLSQQQWWMDSSELDRQNTIESIWKRIGNIAAQNREKPDPSKAEEIVQDTSGKIYGKTTAEEWNPKAWIDTLADANSVLVAKQQWDVKNLQDFVEQDPRNIAECIRSWLTYWSEQTWRDAEKYYPEFIAEVKAEQKKMDTQANVQAIASGDEITTAADNVDLNAGLTSYAVNTATDSTSATQLLKSIDSILESNDTAKSAQELMGSIEKDMATLKNRLKNLKSEAQAAFKWDVPDYLYRAYINNKTQEIQNQLSILEDRYNAAYDRYKTELSNTQWQKEYELKEKQLESKWVDSYVEKNGGTGSAWTWSAKMRTERNNNPTAMTTDYAKMLWWELGVDYEIWDSFISASGKTLYTAKLIGDPIETTIRLLDRALANWNQNIFSGWTYAKKLWLNNSVWANATPEEKRDIIYKMLKQEWGNMDNMLYYVNQNNEAEATSTAEYNPDDEQIYTKYLSWNYTKPWLETQTTAKWKTVKQFDAEAHAWKDAQDEEKQKYVENKPATWTRKDWVAFDLHDTPTFDSLTYDQQNIVYQLLNLNKNPNTITKRQYGDDFEKILSAVKEINPLWSDADFWQADKVKKEWNTSTKNGSNSRNGTAIATAKDIYEIAWEFDNPSWRDWNGMLNFFRNRLSNEEYTKLLLNLEVLASEYAWALKGNNAAPTEQEIADKKEILAANLWAWAMQTAAKEVAKTLFNKNANEAVNYTNVTLEKAPLIVTQDVADWMYDVVWIKEMTELYNYTPSASIQKPRELKTDTGGYKGKSIMWAFQQPKTNNDLKSFTADWLNNRK